MDPFLRQFFGDQFDGQLHGQRQPQGGGEGSGSGVIIAANGYIVTNNHVIDKASKIMVVMDDKRALRGRAGGRRPQH
ncbi:MAG: trypsin-like peptidase domain-containing protein [Hymenobacter sp.]